MAEIVVLGPAIVTASIAIIKFVKWLGTGIQERREAEEERKERADRLFGLLGDAYIVPGVANPWFEPEVHAYDKEACTAARDIIRDFFKRGRKEEYIVGSLGLPDFNSNICSIGGPVSHKLTRFAMGYDKNGKLEIPTTEYTYDLEGAEASTSKVTFRHKDRIWHEFNWYIINSNTKRREFVPIVGSKGYLETDYLMLIVAPNTFTKLAYDNHKKHLMIGGTHGIANMGAGKIFEKEVLEEIDGKVGTNEFFQVVLKVPKLSWEKGRQVPKFYKKLKPEIHVSPIDPEKFVHLRNWESWKNWL